MDDTTQIIRKALDAIAHRTTRDSRRYVKSTGISMPQFVVLMLLHHQGLCSISEIGERMDITSAATSQLVDKLVQGGLIEREEDPNDRRVKQITLSVKGREMIRRGIDERYRWVESLAREMGPEEREKIGVAMSWLTDMLKKLEEQDSHAE